MTKDFIEDIEVIAILKYKEDSAPGMRATFSYGAAAPGTIKGQIYGNEKNHDEIESIFGKKSFDLQLISDPAIPQQSNIIDSNLTIKKFYPGSGFFSIDSEREYKIVDFELSEFTQADSVEDKKKCKITYLLYGPEGVWMDFGYRIPSNTGKVEVKSKPVTLQIDNELEVKCIIDNHYLWESDKSNNKDIQKSVRIKSLKFNLSETHITDKIDLLPTLDNIVDRILLAASFVGRSRVDWYSRQSVIGSEWIYRYRARFDWRVTERDNSDDLIVPRRDANELLQSMVKQIYKTDKNGFDLKMPIFYLLSSYETKTIEQSFTFAFLSLEKIFSQYFKCESRMILADPEYQSLVKVFKDSIKAAVIKNESRGYLYQKLSGLNRIPLRELLKRIMTELSIDWDDLYPKGKDLTIVDTRNQLLHGGDVEDIGVKYLWQESMRTQAIVERMILRLIGWKDLSEAPKRYKIEFLQRVEDS